MSSDIDDTILLKIWAVINELNVWRFPSRVSFNNLKKLLLDSIVKPLNRAHLQVLKNLSVIERCPLLGVGLTKIVAFGTKHFVRYSRHVRYLGCPLLGGFTVYWIWPKFCLKLIQTKENQPIWSFWKFISNSYKNCPWWNTLDVMRFLFLTSL